MNMDRLILILAVLFLLAVSFFAIGIYLSSRSKHKDTPRREKLVSTPMDESLQEESIHEVARILRDGQSGALMLGKNGVIYRTAKDMNEDERRLLANAAADLHSFLGLVAPSQAEIAKPVPPPVSAPKGVSAASLSSAYQAPSQAKPPSLNPVDVFTRAVASDVPNVGLKAKSITAQIDDILQERVVNTPLEMRGIRLLDAPDGRVVVFVGIENYDGVDAVPDDEVRQAIRGAVNEWERRNAQGM